MTTKITTAPSKQILNFKQQNQFMKEVKKWIKQGIDGQPIAKHYYGTIVQTYDNDTYADISVNHGTTSSLLTHLSNKSGVVLQINDVVLLTSPFGDISDIYIDKNSSNSSPITVGSNNDGTTIMAVAYAPNGAIFNNGASPSLQAHCDMWRGSIIETSGVSYQWYIIVEGVWTPINADATFSGCSGYNTNELTIMDTTVLNYESFKCIITDNMAGSSTIGQSCFDIINFIDKTDPLQIDISASNGIVFLQGVGSTILTTNIWKSGVEVDLTGVEYTYIWTRYDKDGTLDNIWHGTGSWAGTGATYKSITITDLDVDGKATFVCDIQTLTTPTNIARGQITINDVYNGKDGLAYDMSLGFSGQVFSMNKAGTVTPSAITLTANLQNIDASPVPVYTWYKDGVLISSAVSNSYTVSNSSDFAITDKQHAYKCVVSGANSNSVVCDTLTDTVTLVQVQDGSDSFSIFLTNEDVTLVSDNSGNVTSYTGASTGFKVYQGSTDVSVNYVAYLNTKSDSGIILSPAITSSDGTSGAITITYVPSYADSGYVDLDIKSAGGGTLIGTKRFTYSKAKQGSTGTPGANGINGTLGATGATGKSFRAMGIWNASTTYANNLLYTDIVTDGASSYYCEVDNNLNHPVSDTTYWGTLAIQGAQGPIGPIGPSGGATGATGVSYRNMGAWMSGTTYVNNTSYIDTVNYLGSLYACVALTNYGVIPVGNPSYWICIVAKGDTGNTGAQGIQGNTGATGQTTYFHVAYANSSDGSSGFNYTSGTYIGTYVDYTSSSSGSPSAYNWNLIKGIDGLNGNNGTNGTPGTNGTNGQTSYLHIKYSNDGGATLTANSGETVGTYLGQYTDFTLADSLSVSMYTWALIKGTNGTNGTNGVDANLLDWVSEWNGLKVTIAGDSIITPKIFAGINGGSSSSPVLTGVAMGRDVLGGTNSSIGIVAYNANSPTFMLNTDGSAQFGMTGKNPVTISASGTVSIPGNLIAGTISGITITGTDITATSDLKVSSNIWEAGSSNGITFGSVVSGYDGPAYIKLSQGLAGDGSTNLHVDVTGGSFIVHAPLGEEVYGDLYSSGNITCSALMTASYGYANTGKNYMTYWSGTVTSNSSTNFTHNLGYKPIVMFAQNVGGYTPGYLNVDVNTVTLFGGASGFSGTVYLY